MSFQDRVYLQPLAPLLDGNDVIAGVLGTTQDVTFDRYNERALRESEEQFRTAFDHAPIGKALVGLDGRFLKANRALCKLLGCLPALPGHPAHHSLKVDGSFTAGLPDDQTCVTIVSATVGLAADLGMSCVVEGVETIQQLDALPASPQLLAQGYLYSRPHPASPQLPAHLTPGRPTLDHPVPDPGAGAERTSPRGHPSARPHDDGPIGGTSFFTRRPRAGAS